MTDASNDWLDVAKTRAQGIRAALAGIGVFIACVLVTVFGQFRQYAADSRAEAIAICFLGDSTPGSGQVTEDRAPSCPAAPDRGILQAAYEEFPRQQIDAELTPWNQFAMESTIIGSFVEGVDPRKFAGSIDPTAKLVWMLAEASSKTPLKPGTTKEISHFYLHLKDFDSDIRSVEGALDAKTPFEGLDRDQVRALAKAYAFNLDRGDIQGEYAAQGLANPTFIIQLDQLRPSVLGSQGHPIMEEQFVQTLRTGVSLSLFKTLRQQLVGIDLAKFQQIDDPEMKNLLKYLMLTPFPTVGSEQNEYARLHGEIEAILNGNSAITLPFLNLSINLSAFASLSGILNLALLGWIFLQARQMDDALDRYLTFGDADRSRIEAALQGLPRPGRWNLLSRTGLALLVTMPTLLGTLLLFEPLWLPQFERFHLYSLLYLILPAVVFLLSLALVKFIQKSNRQVPNVPHEPQGGAAATTS